MTSQNLAGAAVLRSYGYQPPLSKVLSTTGLASMLIAPLGGHHINLTSITSAMSANPDVGLETRYGSVIAGGVVFILMGLACASLIPYAYAAPANLALDCGFGFDWSHGQLAKTSLCVRPGSERGGNLFCGDGGGR